MSNSNTESQRLHNYSLDQFATAHASMVATNSNSYASRYGNQYRDRIREYTQDDVKRILKSGNIDAMRQLSQAYFMKDGFYKQLVLYYATLLKYSGILIPNPSSGKKLSSPFISKKYYQAVNYVDKMNLPVLLSNWATKIFVEGCYYGVLVEVGKNTFCVLDLPTQYCRTRFKDFAGNDVIEFDLTYFGTIIDANMKKVVEKIYPSFIIKAWHKYKNGRLADRWIIIPSDIGICIPLLDSCPFFVNVIPAIMQYEEAVETDLEREKEEIRKIIVQKIPHLTDGRLLFEPEEAKVMHDGSVGMVRNNKNTTVLTTYADVDAVVSTSSGNNTLNSILENMRQNIYSQAGVTKELFAATSGNTVETSLKYDTALVMTVANKFATFVTNIINRNFSNSNIDFKYTILPITHQNEQKYIDSSYKLGTAGYSLLVPALAQGFTQRDLINIKSLENDLLDITEILLPPKTSYTQSTEVIESEENNGRPAAETEDKSDTTIAKEESIESTTTIGGSE